MNTGLRQRLALPDGYLAYDLVGDGPLVVTSPGMGDLRTVFRDVAGPLVATGHRVASVELRGHGDSSTTFTEHGLAATTRDLVALVEHLGGPAVLIGHSISAGAAARVAAQRPDLVAGLVLLDPHLQAHPAGAMARLQVSLLLRRPWGAAAWAWYYRSLHRGAHAPWFDEHVAAVRASLRDPGHLRSFGALAASLLGPPPPVTLGAVAAPTLVAHGALDPEFPDPAAELDWAVTRLSGAATTHGLLVPDAGHYPHSQRPDVVLPAVAALLADLLRDGDHWAAPGA